MNKAKEQFEYIVDNCVIQIIAFSCQVGCHKEIEALYPKLNETIAWMKREKWSSSILLFQDKEYYHYYYHEKSIHNSQ